ncbi:MAG TPA: hypothetical protein VFJ82_11430 [Longimicrobium sp.]|nr:hypothetical protein [Longimicrobium sp.]
MALALLPALAACVPHRGAEREPADARLLDGVWTVEFMLDTPLLPGHMPRQPALRGQMALLRNASLSGADGLSGRPTHSGSYAARFRPFGFEIDDGGVVPGLEARVTPGDSVEIALQPEGPAGVRMRGVLAGDSVAGTWLYDHARAGVASGRFVMRRR